MKRTILIISLGILFCPLQLSASASCPERIRLLASDAAVRFFLTRYLGMEATVHVRASELTLSEKLGAEEDPSGGDNFTVRALRMRMSQGEKNSRTSLPDSKVRVGILSSKYKVSKPDMITLLKTEEQNRSDRPPELLTEENLKYWSQYAVWGMIQVNQGTADSKFPRQIQRTEGQPGQKGVFRIQIPIPPAVAPMYKTKEYKGTKLYCFVRVDPSKRQFIREMVVHD